MAQLSELILGNKDQVQSAYLMLDAAGSDGTDGSARGIHLRWDFLRSLGNFHLPKGNLAVPGAPYAVIQPFIGFNKPDDFVQVFRTPYITKFPAVIDFSSDKPKTFDIGNSRRWEFEIDMDSIEHTDVRTTLILRFPDFDEYDRVRASYVPTNDPMGFMASYKGVVEIEAKDKLSFAVRIRVKQDVPGEGLTRVETISVKENIPAGEQLISIREKFSFNSADRLPEPTPDIPLTDDTAIMQAYCLDEYDLMAENIRYVRFDYTNLYPIQISLETYSDYITGVSGLVSPWESVGPDEGKYALSVEDSTVFSRLEIPGVYDVDKKWPRYYPLNVPPSAGEFAFRANTDNYTHKWSRGGGLKEGLVTYLNNSRDGKTALVDVVETMDVNADPDLKGSEMKVSYLELLNIVSLDYHVARMLGLGHIDTKDLTAETVNRKFIYLSVYTTFAPLEANQGYAERTHYSMTLPTGQNDYKKPLTPEPFLTKGIKVEKGVETPIMLTDEEGYAKDQPLRFININVTKKDLTLPMQSFFFEDNTFKFSFDSETAYYGIEYRGEDAPGVWETYYRTTKIHADTEYFDRSANNEVAPLLNADTPAIYSHLEREPGNHQYAVYAINWFSRPSDISAPLSIETEFSNALHLLPPVNLASQLIQKENVLIFTTSLEQERLKQIDPLTDPTLVRVTFEINDIHYQNHQVVNKAQFFFKENELRSLSGVIKDVPVELPGKKTEVTTTSYQRISDGSGLVNPVISSSDTDVFNGGVFATTEQQFYITNIIPDPANGNRPKVIVEQIESTAAKEYPEGSNIIIADQTFIKPKQGDKFFIAENLQNINNWDQQLVKEVDIINLSPATIQIANSPGNAGNYTVATAMLNGRNTDVYVSESLPSSTIDGNLTYKRKVVGVNMDQANKVLIVKGELLAEISVGLSITLEESAGADGSYTVTDVQPDDTNTRITVQESIPVMVTQYSVSYNKTLPVVGLHQTNKIFSVRGDVSKEIQLTYTEVSYTGDGTPSIDFIGGLVAGATITAIPDIADEKAAEDYNDLHPGNPIEAGDDIPGSMSGVFKLVFNGTSFTDHHDANVEWYKGIVRIPVTDPTSRRKKVLEVIEVIRETSSLTEVGPIKSPLELLVLDSTFNDPSDIVLNSGSETRNVKVNFHPGYRMYLRNETGFNKDVLLPSAEQDSKLTMFTARTVDTYLDATSSFSQPSTIYARKIVEPLPPEEPIGPSFATRPDFFGKSTYTFDVELNTHNRTPFAVVFYRANTRSVLDTIYKPATVQLVIAALAALSTDDVDYDTLRWKDLVNGVVDENGLFKQYISGGYRFPNPDNNLLELYDLEDPRKNPSIFPFAEDGSTTPGSVIENYKRAVESTFVSLTERPVEYEAIRTDVQNGGRITRNKKPVIRNGNGEYILPTDPAYDPAPMAVKHSINILNSESQPRSQVRFTDYTLEGSSNEVYFYYGVEMSNDLTFSGRSPIAGPIKLVDAFPADAPTIKSVLTQLANPIQDIPTAVKFEVDTYLSGERITKYELFRALDNVDALSVRTMKKVKEFLIDVENPVQVVEMVDDFVDEAFPPFGEPLFYRVVASREILNERNDFEFIPSQPSNTVLANIVDVFNPEAPELTISGVESTDFPRRLKNVVISWSKTTHNGTYYIFKMTSSGNYTRVAEVQSNDEVVSYNLEEELIKVDEDGEVVYHRFKVDVENSSGLLNLESKEKTI